MNGNFLRSKLILFGTVIFSLHLLFCFSVLGANYPTKPINLIVGAPPGGPLDSHTRVLTEVASKELGVPLVVINKAGPGGALAASLVANEKPDGYTFLVTSSGTMTANFAIYPNLSYKRSDFVPLFMSMLVQVVVAVRDDSPYKDLKQLLDTAKKNPGKLRSGSYSPPMSMVWEGLLKQEGIDMVHMMYKGASEVFVAVMGGHIDAYVESITSILPNIEAGKARILAFIGSERNRSYPNVPTLKDLGYSSFSRSSWSGFFAPAGLPQPIIESIVPVFEKTLAIPTVQAQFEKLGVSAKFLGPKEFANFVDDEYKFYMELAKQKEKR